MNARVFERLASMQRAQERRRQVLEIAVGVAFGLVMLLVMSAPWDQWS